MIVDENNSLETAMTPLYCGIDLHSNNNVVCVINEKDRRLMETKLGNQAELVIKSLLRYRKCLKGVAVESTYRK